MGAGRDCQGADNGTSVEDSSRFCIGHVPLAHANAFYTEKFTLRSKDNQVQIVPRNVQNGNTVQHLLGPSARVSPLP